MMRIAQIAVLTAFALGTAGSSAQAAESTVFGPSLLSVTAPSLAPAAAGAGGGGINADALALQSGVPANYTGLGGGVSTQRSTTNLRFCYGAGGTYTHCEKITCVNAYVYKNYSPSMDRFLDPIPAPQPNQDYYNKPEAIEVRNAPYGRVGARGLLIYTGPVYRWAFISANCV